MPVNIGGGWDCGSVEGMGGGWKGGLVNDEAGCMYGGGGRACL